MKVLQKGGCCVACYICVLMRVMFVLAVTENVIKRNQVEHTKTERSVLGYIRHPFIVALRFAFQTQKKLYFVLDYV